MGTVKRNTNSAVKEIAAGVGGVVGLLVANSGCFSVSVCVALCGEQKVKI